MQIQLVLSVGHDVIGAKACEVKLTYDPQVPVVTGLINERGPGKNRLETELIVKDPNNTAAWRNRRILKLAPAQANYREDLLFFKGNETKTFPGTSKAFRVALSWK